MKRTPRYGCSETIREPPTSSSPILEIHARYLSESVCKTIATSTPFFTYTGASKTNVVATEASADTLTCAGEKVTDPNGRTFVVG